MTDRNHGNHPGLFVENNAPIANSQAGPGLTLELLDVVQQELNDPDMRVR
jgi:hypothetical protein